MKTPLQYLSFEVSDDGEGQGSWDGMASVRPAALPAAQAELAAVLAWAERHAPGPRGPQEEGGSWDAHAHQLEEDGWITLTLTLTGPWSWGEALLARFAPQD